MSKFKEKTKKVVAVYKGAKIAEDKRKSIETLIKKAIQLSKTDSEKAEKLIDKISVVVDKEIKDTENALKKSTDSSEKKEIKAQKEKLAKTKKKTATAKKTTSKSKAKPKTTAAKSKSKKKAKTFEEELARLKKLKVYKGRLSSKPIDAGHDRDLKKDGQIQAKEAGRRVSKNNKVYYEHRDNRTDARPKAPKPFKLEKGGSTYAGGGSVEDAYHKKVRDWMYDNLPYEHHCTSLDEIPLSVFTKSQLKERKKLLDEFYDMQKDWHNESEYFCDNETCRKEYSGDYNGGFCSDECKGEYKNGGSVERNHYGVEVNDSKSGYGVQIIDGVTKKEADRIAKAINNMKPNSAKAEIPLPFKEGGEITEIEEDGSNIPEELMDVFSQMDMDREGDYKEMERLRVLANEVGYDFDYGLDGTATEFWEVEKKMKSGGGVSDYRTFVEKRPNGYNIRVKFAKNNRLINLSDEMMKSKSKTIAYAKRLAKNNNGKYMGDKK